jgi:uncharacterized protein (DUF1810 family)
VTDADLTRFIDAQARDYGRATKELAAGHKQTHWMWFIFPQLSGLGHSVMAERYAIRDMDQAKRYLADPVLGNHLRDTVRLLLHHKDKSALDILSYPDDLKLRSCLTLFCEAASDQSVRSLFAEALQHFYDGEPDPRTLKLLRSPEGSVLEFCRRS